MGVSRFSNSKGPGGLIGRASQYGALSRGADNREIYDWQTQRAATGGAGGGGGAPADGNLTWVNWRSELERVASENGQLFPASAFSLFENYIWYNAAAFNLADPGALNVALENETMSVADLETYGAEYTP